MGTVFFLLRRLTLFLAVALWASSASATVITFDSLSSYDPDRIYDEAGYRFSTTAGDLGNWTGGGLHFDIIGGPYAYMVEMRAINGSLFSVSSLDISPLSYLAGASGISPYVALSGYRAGVQITQILAGSSQLSTVVLGNTFSGLDRFVMQGIYPANLPFSGVDLHFDITNIVASPVPLPAAGWALLAGMGGLLCIARRRRKA